MFSTYAFAQSATAGAAPSMWEQLMPFVFIFIVFYFLIIRPQQKRNKTQQEFLTSLKRGDAVLTSGGILGTIEGLTDQFVTLEIADSVKVRILRSQIASAMNPTKEEKK